MLWALTPPPACAQGFLAETSPGKGKDVLDTFAFKVSPCLDEGALRVAWRAAHAAHAAPHSSEAGHRPQAAAHGGARAARPCATQQQPPGPEHALHVHALTGACAHTPACTPARPHTQAQAQAGKLAPCRSTISMNMAEKALAAVDSKRSDTLDAFAQSFKRKEGIIPRCVWWWWW